MDYWGLSNHEALKYISQNENKPVKIKILSTTDINISKSFLNKEIRKNIIIVEDHNEASYLINSSSFVSASFNFFSRSLIEFVIVDKSLSNAGKFLYDS